MSRIRLGEAGVCEAIGRSLGMVKFMHTVDLCSWICRTMGHLCASNDKNRERMGSIGACESVVGALQHHQGNANVCTEVCWAFRHLAPVEGNRNRFADEFGAESIISIMKSFASQEVFMIEASKALVAVIENEDDDLIPRIAHSGAIPLVLKSIKKNPSSEVSAANTLISWMCLFVSLPSSSMCVICSP